MTKFKPLRLSRGMLLASSILAAPTASFAEVNTALDGNNGTVPLPTGQYVTPQAVTGAVQQFLNPGLPAYPNFVAGEAVRSQLSPDGATLAVICAGQNSLRDASGSTDVANSTQYIFLYDVSGARKTQPVLAQVIKQTNAFVGLVWSPDGNTLYATGGADDAVYAYAKTGGTLSLQATIPLGHGNTGVGYGVRPNAAGLAISADGATLVVANNYNDSISVIDTGSKTVRYEHDLRPYFARNEATSGVAGGTFPFAVVLKGGTAYVSSDRDREVVAVDISSPTSGQLVRRIKLDGNALGMTLNAAQSLIYVAQDNTDQVAVIDTASNQVVRKIDARAPATVIPGATTGAATYGVTLSPDGGTLYAINAGANSIAVIPLTGPQANTVTGLIPTAYEPHDITFSADGTWMYIVNGKSDTGANTGYLYGNTARLTTVTYPGGNAVAAANARAANQYQFQLERATLVSAKVPSATDLQALTTQVAQNNGYSVAPLASDTAVMNFMRSKIQHVIYVVKENRTFDQILGDLGNGSDGDPSLAVFGKRITPNFHRIASNFVTLDNVMDPGDGSMDGWSWAMSGRVTNTETITQQINYAAVNRGLSYEGEGENRNVPVGLSTAGRDAATNGAYTQSTAGLPGGTANVLVGPANHAAPDAPYGAQQSYIFDAVLRAGGTVRNYGFLVDNIGSIGTKDAPIADPFTANVPQVAELNPSLLDKTDVFFRGYDQAYPDLWRYNEWKREFDQYVRDGNLPTLSMLNINHDHTGSFGSALAGVNTPETQQADNDLAVGRILEAVAKSPYAASTVIFIVEDDCQDGPDHVDSHRATAYAAGAYVKQGAVVSTRYSQSSVLRTIEDLTGAPHMNLYTQYTRPMADIFDIGASGNWSYTATASRILATTTLMAANQGETQYAEGPDFAPTHDAAYWAKVTRGFDFSGADRVPVGLYNQVLWTGLMGDKPYPDYRNGRTHGTQGVIGN
ncbi:MAG: alkaline phosphatase family protein [Acetobacteraceae bacterium]